MVNKMKLNILLLCNQPKEAVDASTIIDHISAFKNYSMHKIFTYSNTGNLHKNLDLNRFEAIIIHYTSSLVNDYYISPQSKQLLRDYQGLKIVFIQDEYRQIYKIISELQFLDADVLFTCFSEQEMSTIYPKHALPNLSLYSNLTGYVPEKILHQANQLINIVNRPIDVGYRSRKVPFWLGQLGYEKWNIVEQWKEHVSPNCKLKVDISYQEEDRIYGQQWINFISSCKTTLGVESGASIMDFTGQLQIFTELHQAKYPKHDFQTIHKKYLEDYEGMYNLNQISPRCFEAAALKTALILFEGEYSGILLPHRHYLPLKKDFSNINNIISCIKNTEFLQQLVDTTYQEIALNPHYSYAHFIKNIDQTILNEFVSRQKTYTAIHYTEDELNNILYEDKKIIHRVPKTNLTNETEVITTPIVIKKNASLILISRLLVIIIMRLNNNLCRKIKYFLTQKVILFNPILRWIKNRAIRFIYIYRS